MPSNIFDPIHVTIPSSFWISPVINHIPRSPSTRRDLFLPSLSWKFEEYRQVPMMEWMNLFITFYLKIFFHFWPHSIFMEENVGRKKSKKSKFHRFFWWKNFFCKWCDENIHLLKKNNFKLLICEYYIAKNPLTMWQPITLTITHKSKKKPVPPVYQSIFDKNFQTKQAEKLLYVNECYLNYILMP